MNKSAILRKVNKYPEGAKIAKLFPAIAGGRLAECKNVDADCLRMLNLSGDNEELTLQFLIDSYVIATREGNSVLTEDGAFLGRMMGGEFVVSENALELFSEEEEDIELDSHKKQYEDYEGYIEDTGLLDGNESTEVLEDEEESNSEEDEVESVDLDNSSIIYSSFIKNKVADLLKSYNSLYSVCYENSRPKGILTPEGIYTLNGKLVSIDEESRAELSIVYKLIQDTLGTLDGVTRFNSKVSPKGIEMGEGKPLYINYHLANMYGYFGGRSTRSTSYKEFSDYIQKRTTNILKKMVSDLPNDVKENDREQVESIILQYIANLKNCILVDDYQQGTVLKLRICVDSAVYPEEYNNLGMDAFIDMINRGYLFKRETVVESPDKSNDVFYLNFIVDSNSYYNSPLFAYEALPILQEQNIKLSWNNMLLGKNTKDELVFGKFGAEQKTFYNIFAGSGSGKGVMTLSILANALASNIPIMYADCKPDMANVLWKVAEGRNVLAFDGDAEGTLNAVEGNYNIYQFYNETVPEPLKDYLSSKGLEKTFVKTYSYIRCLHLAYLISVMRKEQGVSHDDYILFIFDEIGRLGEQVKDLTLKLRGEGDTPKSGFIVERTQQLKAEGRKKEDVATDESITYAKNFVNYCIGVVDKISTAKTAELRKSNSKLLFIWQPDWVKKASLGSISSINNKYYFMSLIYKMIADDNTVKFAGKGASDVSSIGLGSAYEVNSTLFDEYRYFAMAENGEITSNSQIFRPFLLLNDSSSISAAKCVSTNPLAYDKVYKGGNENDIVPEIGFPEYVNKLLNGNIQEPLCRSWCIAEDALESLGYDRDVYKFMYDVSDLRLNLSRMASELDSTQESTVQDSEDSRDNFSSLLKKSSQEDDFVSEEKEDISEESRMKMVFDDYEKEEWEYAWEDADEGSSKPLSMEDELDIFGDNIEVTNTSVESIRSGEFEATVREAEALLNRLKELGVDVSINTPVSNNEPLQRVNNRSVFNFESKDVWNNPSMSYEMLFNTITEDIVKTFGGLERFKSFKVCGGSIGVNGYYYRSSVKDTNVKYVPYDVRRKINSGNIQDLFNYSLLWSMPNLMILDFDSMSFYQEYIQPLYKGGIETLFKTIPSLKQLTIGKETITRESIEQAKIDEKLKESERRKQIGDTIQNACFKGAANSWAFNGRVLRSNSKWYLKAIGVTAGTVGTVASGTAGVGVTVGRKVVSGAKSLAGGIKKLFNE